MTTFSHLWQYLAGFFLEWEMFQIKVVQKTKYTFYIQKPFPENRAIYEFEKCGGAREAADGNMAARCTLD